MSSRRIKRFFMLFFPSLLSLIVWIPLIFLVGGSLMGTLELNEKLGPVLSDVKGYATWSFFPEYPTLKAYVALLMDNPSFFVQFWNSVKIAAVVVVGQLVIAVPAAWWFARSKSKLAGILFSMYIVLMLMPFQVTMVSNYVVADYLKILNTHNSIILPAIFSSFPVFLIYRFFKSIPETVVEAASIDGASQLKVFTQIALPIGKAGIMAALLLAFLEAWNMIEQPMVFIKDKTMWPLSIFLSEITSNNLGLSFAASIVTLMPAVLVFLFGQEYLEQGIAFTGTKE